MFGFSAVHEGARRLLVFPLAFFVICAAINSRAAALHAGELTVGGTGAALGTMRLLLDAYTKSHPKMSVKVPPSLGSSGGIKAVLAGAIILAVSSRPPRKKERAAGAIATMYATTAIVPVVGPGNPLTGITSSELLALYQGKPMYWADGTNVRLVLRRKGEIDVKILKQHIPEIGMALDRLRVNPAIPVVFSDQENAAAIERMSGGFGFVALSLLRSEKRRLKAIALDGVAADPKTIADGSYPLRKPFYFVVKGKPGPQVRDFIAFVRSPRGADLLRRTGHAPALD